MSFSAKPEIHGHRGARAVWPDNTLEAYRYAAELGCDAIEVDVGMSRDQVLVLHHDRHIQKRLLKDLSFDEIRKFRVGLEAPKEHPQQQTLSDGRIPAVEEFIELLKPYSAIRYNLEIKTCPFHPDETWEPEVIVEALLKLLLHHQLPVERVLFQSFDPRSLLALQSLGSPHERSFLLDDWSDDCVESAQEMGCQALSPRYDLLNEARCQQILSAGLKLYTWTPNTPEDWQRLTQWGVTGLITDHPAPALKNRRLSPSR